MSDQPAVEFRKPTYDELYTSFGALQNELAATHAAIRALRDKFVEYRDAPMPSRGSKVEVLTIRKTLNVVVCEMDRALARLLGEEKL